MHNAQAPAYDLGRLESLVQNVDLSEHGARASCLSEIFLGMTKCNMNNKLHTTIDNSPWNQNTSLVTYRNKTITG